MKIIVTGSHGLIGKELVSTLQSRGDTVTKLIRTQPRNPNEAYWNPDTGELDPTILNGADALIHLAGRNINARWTPTFKSTLLAERAQAAHLLCTTMAACKRPPKTYIVASASGVYGPSHSLRDESAPLANDFLARVGQVLETPTPPPSTRKVMARLGVILSPKGGALQAMLTPFKLGLGGPIGTGTQVISWVALPDAISALLTCIDNPNLQGPVNICSPHNVTQGEFARTLGKTLHRPVLIPMPAWMLRLLFGEMGETLLLQSWGMTPSKLTQQGFSFSHPTLAHALQHLLV